MNNFFIDGLNKQLSRSVMSISAIDEITDGITQADTFRVWTNSCRMFANLASQSKDFNEALHNFNVSQYFINKLSEGYSITEFENARNHVRKLAVHYLNNDSFNFIHDTFKDYQSWPNINDMYKQCKLFDEIIEYFSIDSSKDLSVYDNFKKYRKEICEYYLKYLIANRWVNYISKNRYLKEKLHWQEIASYGELILENIETISSGKTINLKLLEEHNMYD